MAAAPPLLTSTSDGIRIAIRAQPKAGRDGIDGIRDTPGGRRLAVKVTAAPDRGRANAAVAAVVARAFGVPPSAVRVATGETSREKVVEVQGDPAALATRFEEITRT